MRLSEIGDMNVVSNAGAVGGGIVGSEDLQFRSGAGCRAQGERDEVTLRLMQFADFSAFVGSGGIEVAQAGEAKPVGTIVSFQCVFEKKLGNAIGIHRLPGRVFGDRNAGWFAINRAGGGKDYLLHSGIDCGVQQGKPAFHIVAKVFSRVRDRFAYVGVSREMHDGLHAVEQREQLRLIEDVAFDEFETVCQEVVAGGEIVVDQWSVAPALQFTGSMTADVAGATDYQHDHERFPTDAGVGDSHSTRGRNRIKSGACRRYWRRSGQ